MDNLSRYLEDLSFINWVFNPTEEADSNWAQFETEHPEEIRNIQLARKIVLRFRTLANTLPEEEKILLFSRVLKEIEEKEKSKSALPIISSVFKYAAVAVIFFSIGALLFYRENIVNPAYFAFNSENRIPENQAQLIRSNGENVILDQTRTVLKYQKNGELVINADTLKPASVSTQSNQPLNQLIIPYGKSSEVLLSDGTRVFLNAGSRLVYPDHFTGKTREVLLNGEGFFEVKHDAKHPFVVLADNLRIKDLGTRFNVSAYSSDDRVETVLAEGKVGIRQNNSSLFTRDTELQPGQMASFHKQSSQISVETVNVEDYTLWTQGIMKFETVDLSRIVKKLERYYNIHFSYNDPMLGTVLISGKLDLKEDQREVLERVARTASVKVTEKGENYYEISKKD